MRETGTLEECWRTECWLINELKAVVFLLALFTVLKYCLPNIEIKLMHPPIGIRVLNSKVLSGRVRDKK